jgi:anti-anti-sigma factor
VTKFERWADHRIGVIEVTGPLDDHAIHVLRGAIAEVIKHAGTPRVLIVEDNITAVSEKAVEVLVSECKALRAKGGSLGLVSQDARITGTGRPSSMTLFMPVYTGLEFAIERLSADLAAQAQPA